MGVGEDENLGNEISVTVIATGFGIEQQNEISNTEAKKIIHSLEDEQKIVHNLIEDQEVKSEFNQPDPTLSQNENEKEELLKYYINMTNENYEMVLREINFFSLQRKERNYTINIFNIYFNRSFNILKR